MKTIKIVMAYDAFNTARGWHPVYSCDSADEANQWIVDAKKNDETYEVRGYSYRIDSCHYCKR